MNPRLSAWATGILLVLVTVACGGGGGQTTSPGATLVGSGTPEAAAPASPTTNSSALKPFTVHAGPPYATGPLFIAFAELVNENDVPVDIGSVILRLLDASGGEIARSELPHGALTARPTDPRPPYTIGGQPLNLWACATPIAPRGELGLELRISRAPADIASYQLEVTPRETHVTANAFSVSDIVQATKERPPGPPTTLIEARVTNRSAETQQGVNVCCGFYDHDVLYGVTYSNQYTSGDTTLIKSLAPGNLAPFRCESGGGDPSVLRPKFWVTSSNLESQLDKEWSDSASRGH